MSFLGNETLKKILPTRINPYNPSNLQNASYELCLGDQYFVTNDKDWVKKEIKKALI